MELKDFLEINDFYTLSNNAKLLYLYLLAYKDENNLVYCSDLICNVLHVNGNEFSELANAGLINLDENEESPVRIARY